MATSIWKGSVSFGLVNIPVTLHSAVRDDNINLKMLEDGTLCPVSYERVCKKTGKPVPWGKIIKGFEYEKGKFVPLNKEDFEKAALATSKAFEIEDFVPVADVDPRFFEKPYYLVPDKGADKSYALLRDAMKETDMIGIGHITLRNKQYLAAIKPLGLALELDIMRFTSELVLESEYRFPDEITLKPQEIKMAKQLIEHLSSSFEPEKYKNQYKENLDKIIAAKLKGKKITLKEAEEPEATDVIDLMERLQKSLAAGGKAKSSKGEKPKAAAKKKTASPTAKKSRTA